MAHCHTAGAADDAAANGCDAARESAPATADAEAADALPPGPG